MAYKTFANGFPLPASDLNNFLMNQSVIVFADSAARTSAIPSPVEGMLTYLEDTNAYESWNGSAFVNINDNTDAIPKSTVTTAQDLIVADGASSVTRLGVGTNDQILSVVAGAVAWADAGGGGGMNSIIEITATNSSYDVSAISGFVRITIIGGGGGGASSNTAGSRGGTTSITYDGRTESATGGNGGAQNSRSAEYAFSSYNSGQARVLNDNGRSGLGGEVKVVYYDLTGASTIDVVIGAGGAGATNVITASAGFRGVITMEYSA